MVSKDLNAAVCAKHCRTRNRLIFGMKARTIASEPDTCTCGRNFVFSQLVPYQRPEAECDKLCRGDKCGGTNRWSVYQAVDRTTIDADTHDLYLRLRPSPLLDGKLHTTCVGGPIYVWKDEMAYGGANDGLAPRHDRAPRYMPNSEREQPYLRFDDNKKMVFNVNSSTHLCGGGVSWVLVFRPRKDGSGGPTHTLLRAFSGGGGASGGGGSTVWQTTLRDKTVTSTGSGSGGGGGASNELTANSRGYVLSVVWGGDGSVAQWVNGRASVPGSSSHSGGVGSCPDWLEMGSGSSSTEYFDVMEVLVFDAPLSPDERTVLEWHLMRRHFIRAIPNVFSAPSFTFSTASDGSPVLGGSDGIRAADAKVVGSVSTLPSSDPLNMAGVRQPDGSQKLFATTQVGLEGRIDFTKNEPCPELPDEWTIGWYHRDALKPTKYRERDWPFMRDLHHPQTPRHNRWNGVVLQTRRYKDWMYIGAAEQNMIYTRDYGRWIGNVVTATHSRITTYQWFDNRHTRVHSRVRNRLMGQNITSMLDSFNFIAGLTILPVGVSREEAEGFAMGALHRQTGLPQPIVSRYNDYNPVRNRRAVDVQTVARFYSPNLNWQLQATIDGTDPDCFSRRAIGWAPEHVYLNGIGKFTVKTIACSRAQQSPIKTSQYNLQITNDKILEVVEETAPQEYVRAHTRLRPGHSTLTLRWVTFGFNVPTVDVHITHADVTDASYEVPMTTGMDNTGVFSFTIPPTLPPGRRYRVRIRKSGDATLFTHGEAFVIPPEINSAFGRPVEASSTVEGHGPSLLVDGHLFTSNVFGYNLQPCARTQAETTPSFTLDMGSADYQVGSVRISLPDALSDCQTGPDGCKNSGAALTALRVYVDNTKGRMLPAALCGSVASDEWQRGRGKRTVTCAASLTGRYVTVAADFSGSQDTALEVCEIEVFQKGSVVCGDGVRDSSEECDDGNLDELDGCSPLCKLEEDWICTPPPAGSTTAVGDTCVPAMCDDSCNAVNGVCDDGGPGAVNSFCLYGSDCSDCGGRCAGESIGVALYRNSYDTPVPTHHKASFSHGNEQPWYAERNVWDRHLATAWRSRLLTGRLFQLYHGADYQRLYLYLGKPQWKDRGHYYYHMGHSVTNVKVFWYRHFMNQNEHFNVWSYNIWNGHAMRRHRDRISSGFDGVTNLGGWLQTTKCIRFEWRSWQAGVRAITVSGTMIPENIPHNEPHLQVPTVVEKSGGYIDLDVFKDKGSSCLFRSHRILTRECFTDVRNPEAPCGALPWVESSFPRSEHLVRVTGLKADTKYKFHMEGVFWPLHRGTYSLSDLFTFGVAVPAEPTNMVLAGVTGGSVRMNWVPPNDTGGVPLRGYLMYVGLPDGDWVRPSAAAEARHSVYLPFGKELLSLDPVAAENVTSSGGEPQLWTYAAVVESPLPVFRVFWLAEQTRYRFRVMSLNLISLCVPDEVSKSLGASQAFSTGPRSRPGKPEVYVTAVSGGLITLSLAAPDDTGGVPVTHYRMRVHIADDARRQQWLKDNNNPDECAAEPGPCDPKQTCQNTVDGYHCSPCPPFHQLVRGACVSRTDTPLLYNQTFLTGFREGGLLYVRGRNIRPSENIECKITGAETLGEAVKETAHFGAGAQGWFGSRIGVTQCGSKTVLGGFEVLSEGNRISKLYSLQRHRGLRFLFGVVVVDTHSGGDRINLPIRMWVDGKLAYSQRVTTGFGNLCGNSDRRDAMRDGISVTVADHVSRTLNLTFDFNTPQTHAAFLATTAADYRGDHTYKGYFGLTSLQITMIDVPSVIRHSSRAQSVSQYGFNCLLPFNERSKMPRRALPRPLSLEITRAGEPFRYTSPEGHVTEGVPRIVAFPQLQAGSNPASNGGSASSTMDGDADVNPAGMTCSVTLINSESYWDATLPSGGSSVAVVRVSTTATASPQRVKLLVDGAQCGGVGHVMPLPGNGLTTNLVCDPPLVGSVVMIQLAERVAGSVSQLALCEVEVYPDTECSPGCPLPRLMDSVCQPACNTTTCDWDRGLCLRDPLEHWYLPTHEFVDYDRSSVRDPVSNALVRHVPFKQSTGQPLYIFSLPFHESPLLALSDYRFMLQAETAWGTGWPLQLAASTSEATVPGAPPLRQEESTLKGSFMKLVWSPPLDYGGMPLSTYLLYRDPNGMGILLPENLLYNGTTLRSYSRIIELKRSYTFRLLAVNQLGQTMLDQAPALEVKNMNPGPPQPPPRSTFHSSTGGSVSLWVRQAPLDGGMFFSAYRVYMSAHETGPFNHLAHLYLMPNYVPGKSVASAPTTNGTDLATNATAVPVADSSSSLSFLPPDPLYLATAYAMNGFHLRANTPYYFTTTASNDPRDHPDQTWCTDTDENGQDCLFVGESKPSPTMRGVTSAPSVPSRPPRPVSVSATGGTIVVQWELPDDWGGTDLRYTTLGYRTPGTASYASQDMELNGRTTTFEGAVTGLLANRRYEIAARATNQVGSGEYGPGLIARTTGVSTPTAPGRPSIPERSSVSLTLLFTPPSDLGGVELSNITFRVFLLLEGNATYSYPTVGNSSTAGDGPCQRTSVVDAAGVSAVVRCADGALYKEVLAEALLTEEQAAGRHLHFKQKEGKIIVMHLMSATRYRFAVTATNEFAESPPSDPSHPRSTNEVTGVLPPPTLGCLYPDRADLMWERIGGVPGLRFPGFELRLRPHGSNAPELKYTLSEPRYTWPNLLPSTTYSVTVAALNETTGANPVAGRGPFSQPTVFTTMAEGADAECVGLRGTISSGVPVASSTLRWHIKPRASALSVFKKRNWVVALTFTSFHLECDYDSLTVSTYGSGRTIWSGGCLRPNTFLLRGDTKRNVTLDLTVDGSFQHQGFTVEFQVVDTVLPEMADHLYTTVAPTTACAGALRCGGTFRGACNKQSVCSCAKGWLGEDCSHPLFCPGDGSGDPRNLHLCATLDKLVVVSPDGDDAQALVSNGAVGVQARGGAGKRAKPFRTLQAALNAAVQPDQVVVVYGGEYRGAGNHDIQLSSSRRVEGVMGMSETLIDGSGGHRLFSVTGSLYARGLTFQNGHVAEDGAGLLLQGATASLILNYCTVRRNSAAGKGGGIAAVEGSLTLQNSVVSENTAGTLGGGLFLQDSPSGVSWQLLDSNVTGNTAQRGGGIYGVNVDVRGGDGGRGGPSLLRNVATVNGGNLGGESVSLSACTVAEGRAPLGAGMYLTAGTQTFTNVTIRGNSASHSGGGLGMEGVTTSARLWDSTVTANAAPNGGGLLLRAGATAETIAGFVVEGNRASTRGGNALLLAGATLKGARLRTGTAPHGAGVHVSDGGVAYLTDVTVEECAASASGGGLHVTLASTARLRRCALRRNRAPTGGGAFVTGDSEVDGGGSTALRDNTASRAGGGVALTGRATLRAVAVEGCFASLSGGGIHAQLDSVSAAAAAAAGAQQQPLLAAIHHVSLSRNKVGTSGLAGVGGGIAANASGPASVLNISFATGEDNAASYRGGALHTSWVPGPHVSAAAAATAGVAVTQPDSLLPLFTLHISHLSMSDNKATEGGGAYFTASHALLRNSSLLANSAARGGGLVSHDSRLWPLDSRGGATAAAAVRAAATAAAVRGRAVAWQLAGALLLLRNEVHGQAWETVEGGGALLRGVNSWAAVTVAHSRSPLAGAGIVADSHSHSSLRWCRSQLNSAQREGGGLLLLPLSRLSALQSAVVSNGASKGGGFYCRPSSSLSLSDSTVGSNSATEEGGGGYVAAATAHLSGTAVSANQATTNGGGLLVRTGGNASLYDSHVDSNDAKEGGGAFVTSGGSAVLRRTSVSHNAAEEGGGLLVSEQGSKVVTHTTQVEWNTASGGGGAGAQVRSGALLTMVHSSLSRNAAARKGGAAYLRAATLNCSGCAAQWNTAQSGGALRAENIGGSEARAIFSGSTISSNNATADGGGMSVRTSVVNCAATSVSSNRAAGVDATGGGVKLTATATASFTHTSSLHANVASTRGGGVDAVDSTLSLTDSSLTANKAMSSGGGASLTRATATFTRSVAAHNRALGVSGSAGGGGVYADRSTLTLIDSTFRDNSATGAGGGLVLTGATSQATLLQSTLQRNRATSGGGADVVAATITLTRSNLTANVAHAAGGGLRLSQRATATLTHTVVEENKADTDGGGVSASDLGTHVTMTHCNATGNEARGGGGALYLKTCTGVLRRSRFTRCGASKGGALFADSGASLTLSDTLLLGNSASAKGGGIMAGSGATVNVTSCEFLANRCSRGEGGAACVDSQSLLEARQCVFRGRVHRLSVVYQGARGEVINANFGAGLFTRGSRVLLSGCRMQDLNGGSNGGAIMSEQSDVVVSDTRMLRVRSDLGGAIASTRQSTLRVAGGSIASGFSLFDGGAIQIDKSRAWLSRHLLISRCRALENGGGLLVGTGCDINMTDVTVERCISARGGGLYLARQSHVDFNRCRIAGNLVSSDGGGLHAGSTTSFNASDTTWADNMALWMGGGLHMDGRAQAVLYRCLLHGNLAKSYGGGAAVRGFARLMTTPHPVHPWPWAHGAEADPVGRLPGTTEFLGNEAVFAGGGLALIGKGRARMEGATFTANVGASGGGFFTNDDTLLVMVGGRAQRNIASPGHGGAAYLLSRSLVSITAMSFVGNNATTGRGAGLYTDHTHMRHDTIPSRRHAMVLLKQLHFADNYAATGGGFFWEVTYYGGKVATDIKLNCTACTYANNFRHDFATRAMRGILRNFPSTGVRSGVRVTGGGDGKQPVLIDVVDFYNHIDVLDSTTVCKARTLTEKGRILFERAQAKQGAASYAKLMIKGEIGDVVELEISCIDEQNNAFPLLLQNTYITPCIPGEELTPDKVCKQCPPNTYSLRGLACQDCPRGAVCSRETSIEYQSIGVDDPITKPGYWKFEARRSIAAEGMCEAFHHPKCNARTWWDSNQGKCLKFEKEYGWTPEIVYACVADREIYLCPLGPAACPGEMYRMAGLDASKDILCNHGYDGLKCSVCLYDVSNPSKPEKYFRSAQDTCVPCPNTGDDTMDKMIYGAGALTVMSFMIFLVCVYLKEDPGPQIRFVQRYILCCIFSGKRAPKVRSKKQLVRTASEEADDFIRRHDRRGKGGAGVGGAPLGYEAEDAGGHRVLLRAEKPKIILVNLQIFSQMKQADVIDWPMMVQTYIALFNAAQLDIMKLVAVDCMVKTDFFDSFVFVAAFPFGSLATLWCINSFGRALFFSKLKRFPRTCLQCGTPITETTALPPIGAAGVTTHVNPTGPPAAGAAGAGTKVTPLSSAGAAAGAGPVAVAAPATLSDTPSTAAAAAVAAGGGAAAAATALPVATVQPSQPGGAAGAGAAAASPFSKSVASSSATQHGVRLIPTAPHSKRLPAFRSQHRLCRKAQMTPDAKAQLVKLNVAAFRKRCLKRFNFREFQNKMYKLFFWMLLMSYTPVSSKLIQLFKCTEVGKTLYLQADIEIKCEMPGRWFTYVMAGGAPAFLVFVLGIPLLFYYLLSHARTYHVKELLTAIHNVPFHDGERNLLKMKLLAEAKMEAETHRKLWVNPETEEEEDVILKEYLCKRNMRTHRNTLRLGFIYKFYSDDVWWYELVELSRKFWIVAVLYFFAPGTVLQIIVTLICTVAYLGLHSESRPYRRHTDTRLATMAHLQLCITVFCGLLIKLDVPWLSRTPNFREQQENVLSWIIIFVHSGMLAYGLTSIILDRLAMIQEHEAETQEKLHHAEVLRHVDHFSHKTREVMKALHVKHGRMPGGSAAPPPLNSVSAAAERRNQAASVQILEEAKKQAAASSTTRRKNGGKRKASRRGGGRHKGKRKHKKTKVGPDPAAAAAAAGGGDPAAAEAAAGVDGAPDALDTLAEMEAKFMETVSSYEAGMAALQAEMAPLQQQLDDASTPADAKAGLQQAVAAKQAELDRMFAELNAYADEYKKSEGELRAKVQKEKVRSKMVREKGS